MYQLIGTMPRICQNIPLRSCFARNLAANYCKLDRKTYQRPVYFKGSHKTAYRSLYHEQYEKSITNPEEFWDKAATGIHWMKPYEKVVNNKKSPFTKW